MQHLKGMVQRTILLTCAPRCRSARTRSCCRLPDRARTCQHPERREPRGERPVASMKCQVRSSSDA
eukprot:2010212-Rhodomonas_salina.1